MLSSVASRISSGHWASRGYGTGKRNRMECGGLSSLVAVVVGCSGGCNKGMCIMELTPLWSKNA